MMVAQNIRPGHAEVSQEELADGKNYRDKDEVYILRFLVPATR